MTREQRRLGFLGASALVLLTVVVLAREVMLPIILGIVVGYVIWPIVRRLETRKVPRALAILLTYVVILGSLGLFVRVTAHRLGAELSNFAHEMPTLLTQAREKWIPNVERHIRAVRGMHPQGATKPADDDTDEAFVVRPHPDGSFGVEVEDGLHVRRAKDGFVVTTKAPAEEPPFDADKFLNESVEQSLDYARTNAVELARLGGGVLAAVSRVILIFGLTLMIGAYLIITKEKIGAFFLSLARSEQRPDLK
ncbi:MAG: AI-2E family transporter [Polyangiaceae bacterium]